MFRTVGSLLFAAVVVALAFAWRSPRACAEPPGHETEGAAEETEKEEEPEVEHEVPPTFGQVLAVQALGFAILALVLLKYAVPPLRRVLSERTERIRKTYEELDGARREIERLTQEYETRLAGMEKEAAERIAKALEEGTQGRDRLLAEALEHAEHVRRKAEAEIELEKQRALEEIRTAVVERSFATAQRLASRVVTDEAQDRLVEEYLKELERVPLS
ncbi:MAG: F0F1 ATP synthase subunit B [Planctomycetes bacterium]|nr:F0F1 ATP synthase subunit B [Planctomycetota bacterium]